MSMASIANFCACAFASAGDSVGSAGLAGIGAGAARTGAGAGAAGFVGSGGGVAHPATIATVSATVAQRRIISREVGLSMRVGEM